MTPEAVEHSVGRTAHGQVAIDHLLANRDQLVEILCLDGQTLGILRVPEVLVRRQEQRQATHEARSVDDLPELRRAKPTAQELEECPNVVGEQGRPDPLHCRLQLREEILDRALLVVEVQHDGDAESRARPDVAFRDSALKPVDPRKALHALQPGQGLDCSVRSAVAEMNVTRHFGVIAVDLIEGLELFALGCPQKKLDTQRVRLQAPLEALPRCEDALMTVEYHQSSRRNDQLAVANPVVIEGTDAQHDVVRHPIARLRVEGDDQLLVLRTLHSIALVVRNDE